MKAAKMFFCTFGQGVVNTICLRIFLKLFEVLDMDDSFPTSRSM
jgi:hypothetical protein